MSEPKAEGKAAIASSLLRRFVKETFYTSFSSGLITVFGMVNMMIVARYLSRSELGIFLLLEILADFLRMISAFGIGLSVTQSIASAPEEDKWKIANSVILFSLLSLCLATAIFFWGQNWFYALLGGSGVAELGIFLPFMLLVQAYRQLLRFILQGYFRFKQMALIDLAISIFNLVMIIVFIVLVQAGLTGQILARVLSWGVGCLVFYLAIPGPKSLRIYPEQLFKVIRFGMPLQLNDVIEFVVRRTGVLIIAALLGPAEVALLSVASTVPSKVITFYNSFNSVYIPHLSKLLAEGDKRRAIKLLNTTLRMVSFVTAFAALIAALFADEVIVLLFSEKYLEGVTVFVLSAAALNIFLVGLVVGMSLLCAGDSKNVTFTSIVASIIILPSNLTSIALLGVNGVPVARIIGNFFGTLLNAWFLRRRQIFANLWQAYKPTLIMIGFCVPVFYLRPIPWLYRGPILILFLIVCYLLSVITREDISQALSLIRAFCITKRQVETKSTGVLM